jgi:hypothetical protein
MNLKQIIERAEKATGSQKELALQLGQSASRLRDAKSGRCGLPNYACVMIADMIGVDRTTVIAASELVTEKKKERREVWQAIMKHAAVLFFFGVILNMSLTPTEGAPVQEVAGITLYIM